MTTHHGRLWADRADLPRAIAVSCGGYLLLSGSPEASARPRWRPWLVSTCWRCPGS
ncbi:hypothetical protein [Streptomyces sp. NPDC001828]|uniref:hypothetical protein n=1 Tax=Streptomyces sp. NPDC001828 TaxID=3364615 RepID=UPI003691911B